MQTAARQTMLVALAAAAALTLGACNRSERQEVRTEAKQATNTAANVVDNAALRQRLRLQPNDPAAAPLLARAMDVAAHLVLPALTLILVTLAGTMRFQRGAMLEVLRLPYIVTARAKGVPEMRVTWRHAWRNAVFPMVTLLALWLPLLVTGSVFVEAVFAWPGLGSLAAAAAGNRDYPLLMGVAILAGGLLVGSSMVADLAYAALDPRVRLA